jgi:hypothetical protein
MSESYVMQNREDRPAKWEAYSATPFQGANRWDARFEAGRSDQLADTSLFRHLWRMLARSETTALAEIRIEVERPPDDDPEAIQPLDIFIGDERVEGHDVSSDELGALTSPRGTGRAKFARKILAVMRKDPDLTGVDGAMIYVRAHLPQRRSPVEVVALLDPCGMQRVPMDVCTRCGQRAYVNRDRKLRHQVYDPSCPYVPGLILRITKRRGPQFTVYAGDSPRVVRQMVREHVASQGTPPAHRIETRETFAGLDIYADLSQAAVFVVRTYFGSDRFSKNGLPAGDLLDVDSWLKAGYHHLDAQAIASGLEALWDSQEAAIRQDFDPRDLPHGADEYLWSNSFEETASES